MEGGNAVRIAGSWVLFKHCFLQRGGAGAAIGEGQDERVREWAIEELRLSRVSLTSVSTIADTLSNELIKIRSLESSTDGKVALAAYLLIWPWAWRLSTRSRGQCMKSKRQVGFETVNR